MIEFIYGQVEYKGDGYVVINNANMGYKLMASLNTLAALEIGSHAKVYTDLVVREDDISLFGFATRDEREVYRLLTTVRGIGPRIAIGALSGMSGDTIIAAIRSEDVKTLTKAPGIGKKTAERVILELKDKTDHIHIEESLNALNSPLAEAEEALIQLGYTSYEVSDMLKSIYEEGMTVEDLIRLGLKEMMR